MKLGRSLPLNQAIVNCSFERLFLLLLKLCIIYTKDRVNLSLHFVLPPSTSLSRQPSSSPAFRCVSAACAATGGEARSPGHTGHSCLPSQGDPGPAPHRLRPMMGPITPWAVTVRRRTKRRSLSPAASDSVIAREKWFHL